jgi:AcrR family transcriptional regulator
MAQVEPAQSAGRLSRERILAAALELTGRDGPGALSMRRIAQELDVWPMSLYRYFRDKDELLDALADSAAEEIGAGTGGGPWRDELADLLRGARDAFARHPGGARLHRDRRLRETGLALLGEGGIGRPEALDAWDALMAFASGSATAQIPSSRFEYGLECLLDGIAARS